uniref:C2 domain-containing protein n=1 Tax=Knipowitschia caucasica TaxID=637954 RepID=A0AAV2ME98_KNICA
MRRYCSSRYKLHADQYCDAEDPPYRFIHMLKGISIYPEALSSNRVDSGGSKRIVRSLRREERRTQANKANGYKANGYNTLSDALVDGQLQMGHLVPPSEGPTPCPSLGASPGTDSGTEAGTEAGTEPSSPRSLGCLSLTVDYNFPKKALVVTVVGARGLPAVSAGAADPYVKLTVLPEKKHRVKTRVLRRTLEPLFHETFSFYGLSFSALPDLTLHFLVLSFDRFARHDVIGEVLVPLRGVDPSTGRVHLSQEITKRTNQGPGCGEILASLCYQPVSHRLSVVVLKARNLPQRDDLSTNPYVKVNVFYGRKRIAKKKTHVKKNSLNPVFNESFIYSIPPELLPHLTIDLQLLHLHRAPQSPLVAPQNPLVARQERGSCGGSQSQLMGRAQLGLGTCQSGESHWSELLQSPRRQVSRWHSLALY